MDTARIEEDTPAAAEPGPATDPTPVSEPPQQAVEPASMLEAIEQAHGASPDPDAIEFDPQAKAAEAEQAGTDTEKQEQQPKEDEPDPALLEQDPTEDEVKNYSRKAQARIRNLIEQRNAATEAASRVEPILNFLDENDIPQQDLDVILDLTARLRHGDFGGFLEGVRPYVELARQMTGEALPPDLADQVRKGFVAPQVAQELAQRRVQQAMLEARTEQQGQQITRQQVQGAAEQIRRAVTDWEANVRQRDPDYELKAELVRRTSQAMMQEHGVPRTPQQAIQYAQKAYEEVEAQFARLRPAPRPVTPSPRATSSARGNTAPAAEPQNMLEAAMAGLRAAGG